MSIHESGRLPVYKKKKAGLPVLFAGKFLCCKKIGDLYRRSVQYQFNILVTDSVNGAPYSINFDLWNGRTIFERTGK